MARLRKYTIEQKIQIIELRKKGVLYKDIAKIVGIDNFTTIRDTCRDAGLKIEKRKKPMKYLPGQRYHNFILVKISFIKEGKSRKNIPYWECLCDCGKTFFIATKHMRTRHKSCGCLSKSNRFKMCTSEHVIGMVRFNHYKQGAKSRELVWELSFEKFSELLFSNCYYCKSFPLSLVTAENHKLMVNGVDRVDNDRGYVEDNCVPCCKFCNRAKGNATVEEFVNWIERLTKGIKL